MMRIYIVGLSSRFELGLCLTQNQPDSVRVVDGRAYHQSKQWSNRFRLSWFWLKLRRRRR